MVRCCTLFLVLLLLTRPASALIYLPEHALEDELATAAVCAIAEVKHVDKDAAELTVRDVLLQPKSSTIKAGDALRITGASLRLSRTQSKPRFAAGDVVIAFLTPKDNAPATLQHSVTLRNDAEVKAMRACVKEVLPHAALLRAAAQDQEPPAEEKLRPAVDELLASKNSFTQILMGRVLGRSLAARYAPASWQSAIIRALQSSRKELRTGGLRFAEKFEKLPADLRPPLEKIAADKDDSANAALAKELLARDKK